MYWLTRGGSCTTPARGPPLATLLPSSQDRTLRRARQVVFWPSITNNIRNVVCSCVTCAEHLPSHAPEPLLVKPPLSRPFESTASDLFQLAGHHFLVYTDRFSGWLTVGTCGRTATLAQVIGC